MDIESQVQNAFGDICKQIPGNKKIREQSRTQEQKLVPHCGKISQKID